MQIRGAAGSVGNFVLQDGKQHPNEVTGDEATRTSLVFSAIIRRLHCRLRCLLEKRH